MMTSKTILEVLMRADAEAFPDMPRWNPYMELQSMRRDNAILLPAMETETPTETEAPAAPPAEKPAEEKSALDEAKEMAEDRPSTGGAEPPKQGHCRECGRLRKLNRLKLCYPCWAILVLAEECKRRGIEWKPGDKHPDYCGCEGLGEHPERDHGAWRGN